MMVWNSVLIVSKDNGVLWTCPELGGNREKTQAEMDSDRIVHSMFGSTVIFNLLTKLRR